ncbi:MAG: NADPH dehydrogenase NamA [Firmicutes bacterium]|nr:NADPH dehydrogenase NamA [Bacillota bacterium]
MEMFKPFVLKDMTLKNKIVLPPMDTYCADNEGNVNDIHFNHYVSRAMGGVGLIIVEATAITQNGRISDNCLGIWNDSKIPGLKRIAEGCQRYGSKVAIQINHAGRKCTAAADYTLAPSAIAFDETYRIPREISKDEIKVAIGQYGQAARRASLAGFDALEVHGAHGYLISEFLSPLTNKRTDEYGGSLENRARFLIEVLEEVSKNWPSDKPLLLRVSATDHLPEGMKVEDMIQIINMVKDKVDLVHVSTGGVAYAPIKVYPGYQVKYAEIIKRECQVPTIAVGLIRTEELVNEILGNDRADLVAMGRELFRNPYFVVQTAWNHGIEYDYPDIYKPAFPSKR